MKINDYCFVDFWANELEVIDNKPPTATFLMSGKNVVPERLLECVQDYVLNESQFDELLSPDTKEFARGVVIVVRQAAIIA